MPQKSTLCQRLPHTGKMCLLERVVEWDEDTIQCAAVSHLCIDNPLRNNTGLPAVSGVEYAAQAMAIHGSLVFSDSSPKPGVLARLKNLELKVDWLHDLEGELLIFADKLDGGERGAVYDFRIESRRRIMLSGRATVIYLNAEQEA